MVDEIVIPLLGLVGQLVPDLGVDPQGAGQRQAGFDAGDPAAYGAGDGVERPLQRGHFFQAGSAERVVAVEDPRDAVAAGVFAATHDALQLIGQKHDDRKTLSQQKHCKEKKRLENQIVKVK